jgi:TRAP-type C4-dicarboxylate transport system permease small subunit
MSEPEPESQPESEPERARDARSEAGPKPLVPLGVERTVAALAMLLICVISFANVIVRYATDVSFAFTEEWSVFLLVVMTFAGASLAFARDGHIRIRFFVDKLPAPARAAAEAVVVLASLVILSLLVYYGGQLTWDQYQFDATSPGLGYPRWIYSMWMPILALAAIGRVLGWSFRRLRRARA